MNKIELLSPAGDFEKLKTAFEYGADAVYFAGKSFGLRAYAKNFDNDEMKQSVEYAHNLGKKAYITINIIAHNTDFKGLPKYLKYLSDIKVDAVIVADIGIMSFIKKHAPDLEIHVSTQANITNKYTAQTFVDMGAKRLILAREMSIKEIKEIREYLPNDVQIETFVHGAMCMAYSGRCMLSKYLTNRNANRGLCSQPCRWNYAVVDKKNPGHNYDVEEDDRGTYIFNSKDLKMIEHLDELYKAGVTSFKIEGRMKSSYYVATVVNAYKKALDVLYEQGSDNYKVPKYLIEELNKTSNRKYTTGFYFGSKDVNNFNESYPKEKYKFVGRVIDRKDGCIIVEQRNKFVKGDVLEVLSNDKSLNQTLRVNQMIDYEDQEIEIEVANKVKQIIIIKTSLKLPIGAYLRKRAA